ncbi:MAG: transposase [Deltaproteobacteria bacterium]|nr:transposase [Deltaproteobacteria bacterium]
MTMLASMTVTVQRYLRRWSDRLVLHYLPTYAPDANPIERVCGTCTTKSPAVITVRRWRNCSI